MVSCAAGGFGTIRDVRKEKGRGGPAHRRLLKAHTMRKRWSSGLNLMCIRCTGSVMLVSRGYTTRHDFPKCMASPGVTI